MCRCVIIRRLFLVAVRLAQECSSSSQLVYFGKNVLLLIYHTCVNLSYSIHVYVCLAQYMFNHMLADPKVSFNQPSYTTSEGDGLVEVCVFINLELEVNISGVIFSLDNTSTCKYNTCIFAKNISARQYSCMMWVLVHISQLPGSVYIMHVCMDPSCL